jgi:hypothetical protein
MTQAEPECVAHLVIQELKLNLSVYLIWLFMPQAEPEGVAHLVIHASN